MLPTVNFPFICKIRPAKPRRLSRTSDGDTPVIEQPIRMVSCDTPEKAQYAGKPENSKPKLDQCKQRLESGLIETNPKGFWDYLFAKINDDATERYSS